MRLESAEIDRYGPVSECRPPIGDGITVISGPNEAGKTLTLEAILRLLDPNVEAILDPPPRIEGPPTGRLVVDHAGEQFDCDGELALGDFSPIEPHHLCSVFVVRDADLRLPEDREYYASLIETLGDIHTTEIDAIKSALKARGRLTERRLDISSDQSADNAGEVREEAEALASEIRAYVETMEADGVDELAARRLRLARELAETKAELRYQHHAQTVTEYERLSRHLETFTETNDRLDELEAFDRETLESLRELQNEQERTASDLEALEDEIETKAEAVEEATARVEKLESRQRKLERQEAAVNEARAALETHRTRETDAVGGDSRLLFAIFVTVSALVGAGGAGAAGALTGSFTVIGIGATLLGVAIVGAAAYYHTAQQLATVETARTHVLQAARDAGFDVDSLDEVGPAIESFGRELAGVREQTAKAQSAHQNETRLLEASRTERSALKAEQAERADQLEEQLTAADVESVEEFADQVETHEELVYERRTALQQLLERLGKPDTDDPEEMAFAWNHRLNEIVSDIDTDAIDAADFDDETLEQCKRELSRLEAERDALEERLTEHDRTIESFDDRARTLATEPFIGRTLGVESAGGLEALASDLETVVDRIETDAELSRKALSIFERIEATEEQKLGDLFETGGMASQVFERLTGGRYTDVAYDADRHALVVRRRDGRTFSPAALSQGTTDQLYFASRVSLARQLLGNEPGFFLLDDPFLAADPDRLYRGFEVLQHLATDGWQILYFTAKGEVSETMVDEFDLAHVEMDALPVSRPRQTTSE